MTRKFSQTVLIRRLRKSEAREAMAHQTRGRSLALTVEVLDRVIGHFRECDIAIEMARCATRSARDSDIDLLPRS